MDLESSERQIFFDIYKKMQNHEKLDAIEKMISKIILLHPEVHAVLANPEVFATREFANDEPDPFSHLALHAVVMEMISSDTPSGFRAIYDKRVYQTSDKHAALHDLMLAVFDWWMAGDDRELQANDEAEFLNQLRVRFEIPTT